MTKGLRDDVQPTRHKTRLGSVILMAAVLAVPWSVSGQAALDPMDDLMAEGRYGEARELLESWWGEHDGQPPRQELARGLWYRALLTVDASLAEMDYRRLVVEFPGSDYAEEALLRLARGAALVGDVAAAHRYLDILVQDYPGSPHRLEARSLRDQLAQAPDVREGDPEADAPGETGLPDPAVARDTVEAADEPPTELVPDPISDPAAIDTVAADPPAADPGDQEETAEEEAGQEMAESDDADAGSFAVQLGAFSSPDGARTLAAEVRDEGLDVRVVVVRGSEFFRVRLGAFPTREAAEERAREVEALGFQTVISSDRDREEDPD